MLTLRISVAVFVASCFTPSLSSASELARTTDEVPAVQDRRQMAERFAAEKLDVWKKRLKLEDWNVSLVMARRTGLKQDTLGTIRWDKKARTATIWALDAADYKVSDEEMLKDLEFTVVHELIHLELAALPRNERSRRNEERAVNQLTEALLALDRRQ